MAKEKTTKVRRLTRWQRLGVASLLVFGAIVVSAAVFVLSGIYNIAAGQEHWSVTNTVLTILRDRSIAVAAGGVPVPDLDDSALYLLGEQHFRTACTTCHGQPGEQTNPIYRNMLPQPPDLLAAFEHFNAAEVHWIVANGLKYTGMPAWPGQGRSDEVWTVVAFLKRINRLAPEADRVSSAQAPQVLPPAEGAAEALPGRLCARCHGDASVGPVSQLVPELRGLPASYLQRALLEYRDGRRASGIMAPIAAPLSDTQITALARSYAALALPPTASGTQASGGSDTGRRIALQGDAERDIPACSSCHNGSDPGIPPLAGQPARYLAGQLRLWAGSGYRDSTPHGALMAVVARRLSPAQIGAVSAYYAALARARQAIP